MMLITIMVKEEVKVLKRDSFLLLNDQHKISTRDRNIK